MAKERDVGTGLDGLIFVFHAVGDEAFLWLYSLVRLSDMPWRILMIVVGAIVVTVLSRMYGDDDLTLGNPVNWFLISFFVFSIVTFPLILGAAVVQYLSRGSLLGFGGESLLESLLLQTTTSVSPT